MKTLSFARVRSPVPTPFAKLPFTWSLLVALLAGLAFSLSLAPYGWWWIAIISPAVLYALLIDKSAKHAFWLGQVYGFGTWAVGAFWLYTSIHEYGNIASPLALLMIALMASVMGLFHALMAWLFVRFREPLAFVALWVIQEWTKTWFLSGFPWLFVGYAFGEVAWLNSLAPVFGVFGISFAAVALAVALVEAWQRRFGLLLFGFVCVSGAATLHWLNPAWTKPTGDELSVSLVQGNISQDLKWLTEYQLETLAIYANLSQSEWGQDMVVWPEASIPMTQDEAWEFIDSVHQVARQAGSVWVTGVPYKDLENFNPNAQDYPNFYNSVLALGEGSGGLYKKQRLVPFGEYIPFHGLLNILPDLAGMQNVVSFSAGSASQPPLFVKDKAMGVAICYEVAYPNTTRHNAKDSQFLLTISNDAWFGTSAGPKQHLQMVQMRSLETGRYFVRATNTGISAIIDNKGRIVKQAPSFVPTVLRGTVPMFVGTTPFVRFGHYPILLLSALLIVFVVIKNARANQCSRANNSQKANNP